MVVANTSTISKKVCSLCNGELISSRDGLVCTHCGAIQERLFLKRSKDSSEQNEFVSLSHGEGEGSYLNFYHSSSFKVNSHYVSRKKRKKFLRLKKLNRRAKAAENYRLLYSLRKLHRVCILLALSNQIKSRAAYLFRKLVGLVEQGMLKAAKSNYCLLAALALVMATKESASPIFFSEIWETFKELGSGRMMNNTRFNKIICQLPLSYKKLMKPVTPERYLPRILSKLFQEKNHPPYKQQLLIVGDHLLKNIPYAIRGGRNPFNFAVTIIYLLDRLYHSRLGSKKRLFSSISVSSPFDIPSCSILSHFAYLKDYQPMIDRIVDNFLKNLKLTEKIKQVNE